MRELMGAKVIPNNKVFTIIIRQVHALLIQIPMQSLLECKDLDHKFNNLDLQEDKEAKALVLIHIAVEEVHRSKIAKLKKRWKQDGKQCHIDQF
jgi:hypothetical protein